MKSDVKLDWDWADGHMRAIVDILRQNATKLLSINPASSERDLKKATDLVIRVNGGDIAVRIRRPAYRKRYRDLTLRAWRRSGVSTELEKIKHGFGDWYLYGWSDGRKGLDDWFLVDLHKLRSSGLLDNPRVIYNKDGSTGFIALSANVLRQNGCLVSEKPEKMPKQLILSPSPAA